MKTFSDIEIKLSQVETELSELEIILRSPYLSERTDLLPFFNRNKQLSAFLGTYFNFHTNKIAFEYDLFGDFACDIAIGDSTSNKYCFIELEEGKPNNIFKSPSGKYSRDWATRFEHGYSQVIDWFWKLEDQKNTTEFESRFAKKQIDYYGLLVVGRNVDVDNVKEKNRLDYRIKKVIVDNKNIHCITYDQLLEDLKEKYITLKKYNS